MLNQADLEWCASSYCNFVESKNSILKLSVAESIINLKCQEYVDVYKRSNKPVAFICGNISKQPFSTQKVLNQNFYYTSLQGYGAFIAQKELHKRFIEYARKRHIKTILSAGSYFDEDNIFAKMLEKQGWTRYGYLAVYQL